MSWLDRLEKVWRPFAIPNVTLYLILGQVLCYVLNLTQPQILDNIALYPDRVLAGEVWRLVTFVFAPPVTNALFAFFAWYLFYMMGGALESRWGTARYNLFLLIGYLFTVGVAFLNPYLPASTLFLGGSVFLAFAYLYPDFQLLLFFILPVRVKWLALITWIVYFLRFAFDTWQTRFLILAAVGNFLLFFARDILMTMRARRFQMETKFQQIKQENEPIHRCVVCGVTDKSDPRMEFRYCSKCAGSLCYCADHIRDHEHVTA